MADNIDVTPGTGKTVATDDVAGIQYQVVKLDVGGNGASSPVTDLATSAAQTTGNGILTTIDTDTGAIATSTASADTKLTTTNSTLGTIDADTSNISTKIDTIAGAVTGTEMQVDVLTMPSVTVTATNLDVRDLTSASDSVASVDAGDIAHDAADSGNPVKVGAKAVATLSSATLVAAADRTDNVSDLDGTLLIRNGAALGDLVSGTNTNTDGTSTQVLAAGAAGVKHYITDVTIANSSATNITVELKDGATAKWVFPVPANGGVTHAFKTPIGGTAATAWNFDPSAAATTISCSVSAFKSKI